MTHQSASQQNKRNRRKNKQTKTKNPKKQNKLTLDLDPITNNSVFHTAGVHREDGRQTINYAHTNVGICIHLCFFPIIQVQWYLTWAPLLLPQLVMMTIPVLPTLPLSCFAGPPRSTSSIVRNVLPLSRQVKASLRTLIVFVLNSAKF